MKDNYILCDASSLISLTGSCLDSVIDFFHDKFRVKFVVPKSVEYEAVTHPLSLKTKIYCFSALRIQNLINKRAIDVVPEGKDDKTKELMKQGNHIYHAAGKSLRLLHKGETEMLVLSRELNIPYILMDERTTRFLIESPITLKKHLEDEFNTHVMVNKKSMMSFSDCVKGINVIRSTELVYTAYENGFFSRFGAKESEAAEAALYRLKYAGCAVSFADLKKYSKMIK
ncbi:MAG: hypothetical protein ACLFUZ_04510 [Candidatus Micrarchaeia archaeon]